MKITNDHMFKLFQILGLIGLDLEIGKDAETTGINILNAILKNSKKAQTEIEELLTELTGIDATEPLNFMKAIGKIKKDKELIDFFTQAFQSFIEG